MAPKPTTTGLRGDGSNPATIPDVAWAVAAGTADAITAVYSPVNPALTDGLILGFRAAASNLTATPTFSPDGLTAHTITRKGLLALNASDIRINGEYLVRYNLANTCWVLLNPAVFTPFTEDWAVAAGTADALTASYANVTALVDGMLLYFRASAANATTGPTFAPSGLTAHTITKKGGSALAAGDIVGANFEAAVRYNLANTRWELLNPHVP